MTQDQLKQAVAQAAVDFILPKLDDKSIVGVGTGSTANCFIDALAQHKGAFDGAVASSEATAARLKGHGIPVYELNTVSDLEFYVKNKGVNGHCDCMFLYNTYQWDWTTIAALVAPRPMLFANSDNDRIASVSRSA